MGSTMLFCANLRSNFMLAFVVNLPKNTFLVLKNLMKPSKILKTETN